MKKLVMYMAQAMVDYPDKVKVNEVNGGQTSILELRVAREDIGKVIGKEGKNARAMRTIVSAAASKLHKRTIIEIIE
ncbi:MAG: KH domain-containing protein [Deltaproteobacteria bacterium]|nr:KH domain-containing protein [Deltaproteobacteria bacterium]